MPTVHITGTFRLFGMITGTFAFDAQIPDDVPVRSRFVVPTYRDIHTGEELKMATSLKNDVISRVPMEFDNVAKLPVTPPPDVFTVEAVDSAGAPSTAAAVAIVVLLAGVAVDITPTPGDGTNLAAFTVKFSDPANPALDSSQDFDFTADTAAVNTHFVTTGITTRPLGT